MENILASGTGVFYRLGNRIEHESKRYGALPPKDYAACTDPQRHWTLQPEGESAGRCGFFVKAVLTEPVSLEEARDRYDFVYPVAGFTVHDYGSPSMRHWEVVSKVSSRYYQYS